MAADAAELSRGARLPRSARRKQLLAAAQEVFVAQGYHAAAMDDIAERAGVSKPVLYQHFPGKLELYLALLDLQAESLQAAVSEALSRTEDNRERVHGVLSAYFDFMDGGEGGDEAAFRLIFETDLGNEPAVRERLARVAETTVQAVAETIAADTGLDQARAELLSVALSGAGQVAARWWLDGSRPVPKHEAVGLIEALLWRGISAFPLHAAAETVQAE
ncbi:MAG: TetR/AcrR family transcriptional regulator [Actinobacteria bacterium]|nr:TetR/AcrR family transcriptional regulator [Actinomycetota bacterium]